VLTTPQYPDNTDSADRRRYSRDVIKTMRATEATCSATSKAIAAAIIRGHARVGRLHATRHSWHLTKPTEILLMYFFTLFMMSFLHTRLMRVLIFSYDLFFHVFFADNDGWHLTAVDLLNCYPQTTDNHKGACYVRR